MERAASASFKNALNQKFPANISALNTLIRLARGTLLLKLPYKNWSEQLVQFITFGDRARTFNRPIKPDDVCGCRGGRFGGRHKALCELEHAESECRLNFRAAAGSVLDRRGEGAGVVAPRQTRSNRRSSPTITRKDSPVGNTKCV